MTGTKRHSLKLRNHVNWRIGELPRARFHQRHGRLQAQPAGQMLEHFAITDGLRRRAAERPAGHQPANFGHQSGGEHGIHAAVDALAELGPRPIEHEHPAGGGRPRRIELLLALADRAAGLLVDFDGADDPPLVAGRQPAGRHRIDRREPLVQRFGASCRASAVSSDRSRQSAAGPANNPRSRALR